MLTSTPLYVGLIVTVLPVPTFALANAPVYEPLNVSPATKPLYNTDDVFNVATVLPS